MPNSILWFLLESMDLADILYTIEFIYNYYEKSKSVQLPIIVHAISILWIFIFFLVVSTWIIHKNIVANC